MSKSIIAGLTLAIMMLILIACGGSNSTSPNDNPESFTVTTDGGTICNIDSTITLIIPANAVDADTTITLAIETSYPADPGYVSGTCYKFGPDGMIFNSPITINIRYETGSIPTDVAEATLCLHKVVGNIWQPVTPCAVIEDSSFVTGQIYGFSSYGIVGYGGTIYDGNYDIGTVADIDSFAEYTGITGTLTIYSTASFTDLSGLDNLEWIGGDLIFANDPDRAILEFGDGLSALETISGTLYSNNGCMYSLDFPELKAVGGDLEFRGDSLRTLNFPELVSIGGTLDIQYTHVLTDLTGFDALTSIGAIDISSCSSLLSLEGLEDVHGILRSVRVAACLNLLTLEGLEGITTVSGEVEINNNDALTSLLGLKVAQVGGIEFVNNDVLASIEALILLSKIGDGGLLIQQSPSLTSLQGLNSLGQIEGPLSFNYVPQLTSLDGLAHITSCKSLFIEDCHSLVDISALRDLYYIHETFKLYQDYALTDIDSLYSLNYIGGSLWIQNNWNLENLNGLSNLQQIGADRENAGLYLIGNIDLTDITGLYNLQTSRGTAYVVPGALQISGNAMGNAEAWEFVDAIGGESAVRDTIIIYGN